MGGSSVSGSQRSLHSESETSEDEASLFNEHYASFMNKSMKAMHRSQLNYYKRHAGYHSRPSSSDGNSSSCGAAAAAAAKKPGGAKDGKK